MPCKRPPLGTVHEGSLRPEDLIPCFVDLLDDLKEDLSLGLPVGASFEETEAVKARVGMIETELGRIEQRQKADDYYESEAAGYDLEWLFDALESFAPPYCTFGAHPGDGADFGYWPDMEIIEELPTKADAEDGEDYKEVNDHGNVTVFAGDGTVLLELV